jgi:lycopene cyclase domain-containing protein
MSYLEFLFLFIVPPIVLALALKGPLSAVGRWAPLGLPLMALVALAYTTPWDNYLVSHGVWDYGEDRVIGTIGHVPLEEYLFFVLQPFLTGLWLYGLLSRQKGSPARKALVRGACPAARWYGTSFWFAASLAGALSMTWDPGRYLGLILLWAGPVLALQWAYGGDVIWRARRSWLLGVLVPTAYLWLADRLAIGLGIWRISETYTTGLEVLSLPVEEAVFFLVTNLMVVQGLLLFLWVSERLHERSARRVLRRENERPLVGRAGRGDPLGKPPPAPSAKKFPLVRGQNHRRDGDEPL